jgi:hypothetical protein
MTFTNSENEILAYCYEGNLELEMVKNIIRKYLPASSTHEILKETENVIKVLLNRENISFKKCHQRGYIFNITSLGEDLIEEFFTKTGNENFIKTY